MSESIYDIVLKTALGNRIGKMRARFFDDKIEGTIALFNHREPFFGKINPDGSCNISGKIITLLNTLNFIGIGSITKNFVSLNISAGNKAFEITGAPVRKKGGAK